MCKRCDFLSNEYLDRNLKDLEIFVTTRKMNVFHNELLHQNLKKLEISERSMLQFRYKTLTTILIL